MPKVVDHDQRRNEIAEAAAQIIAEQGMEGCTMLAISQAAGVTTGAVTHYFRDKNAIVLAALRWADESLEARTLRAFEEHKDIASIVLAALPTDRASRIQWLVWGVFSDYATRVPALMTELRERDAEWIAFARSIIEKLNGQGKLGDLVDIELEAKMFVAMIDGLGCHAAVDPKTWPEKELRRIVEYYLARHEAVSIANHQR